MLTIMAGSALACEDDMAASGPKPLGGTPGALVRAGIGPTGVSGETLAWSRAPATTSSPAAVMLLDARALRGGVHGKPIEIASGTVAVPGAD
ncbi:hypothetical protein C3941_23290 [Kaistia algarum]|nr:hypothetical protein C3941_23290 [Kaistia algarum]